MIQSLKSILIGFLYDEGKPSSALRYGLALAEQAGAHASICGLLPKPVLTHAFVSKVAAGLLSAENQRLHELAEAAVRQARQDAEAMGVPCTAEVLQEPYSTLAASFTQRAHVHDITIIDAQLDPISLDRGLLEEVLFKGGRPLLVIPPAVETFHLRNIIVGWDGSAVATRAVNAALPFLQTAENVEIVTIQGEEGASSSAPYGDLVPHLARHGVRCTGRNIPAVGGKASETLLAEVAVEKVDMLVMGAFGHSWMRELVLGGVTETMLNTCPVPLCLSH